jgi:hypothetical protein
LNEEPTSIFKPEELEGMSLQIRHIFFPISTLLVFIVNEDLKKAFGKYDKKKTGRINPADIADVFRMAGQNPTNHETSRMIELAEELGTGMIMFNEMLPILEKFWRSYANYAEELKEACIGNLCHYISFIKREYYF